MNCSVCSAVAADTATLCAACLTQTQDALRRVATLWRQLDIVRCRLTTYTSGRVGGRSSTTPLPWVDVTEAEQVVADTLAAWVADAERATAEACPHSDATPRQAVEALWLSSKANWIRHTEDAFMLHDEAEHIAMLLAVVVDRPADARYVGPCEPDSDPDACTGELYAQPGRDTVICPVCGVARVIADRHAELLDAAQDRLETAAVCARAVTLWGEPVRADRIRKWKERGRITVRGHDTAGSPLYRLGDVIDLAREDTHSHAQRRTG